MLNCLRAAAAVSNAVCCSMPVAQLSARQTSSLPSPSTATGTHRTVWLCVLAEYMPRQYNWRDSMRPDITHSIDRRRSSSHATPGRLNPHSIEFYWTDWSGGAVSWTEIGLTQQQQQQEEEATCNRRELFEVGVNNGRQRCELINEWTRLAAVLLAGARALIELQQLLLWTD